MRKTNEFLIITVLNYLYNSYIITVLNYKYSVHDEFFCRVPAH